MAGFDFISDTFLEVVFQCQGVGLLQGSLNGLGLMDDVNAVLAIFNHFDYLIQMTAGYFEPVENSFFSIFGTVCHISPLWGYGMIIKVNRQALFKPTVFGLIATASMFALYFGLITLLSGWNFSLVQWVRFWPFVSALAIGFGMQVGIYFYLRKVADLNRGAVITTGTTSGLAMAACCAHHLTNLLPILGVSGLATLVTSSQVELFWVGLAFNLAGLIYISRPIWDKSI